MDVDANIEKIKMKKAHVFTIQVCISLVLGWDFGRKAGLAVDLLGILLDAEKANTKELQKMLLLSSVLIMEKSIQNLQQIIGSLLTQIGFVVRTI